MAEIDHKSKRFHELYVRDRQKLVRFARSYVRDEALAEDIVMESLANCWEHRDSIRENTSPMPYILTSVRNLCLNHLKAQQVRLKAHTELHDTEIRILNLQIMSVTACDPAELLADEAQKIFDRAVDELPERTREVFERGVLLNQSYRQITDEMSLSFGTVDHEMRRAKKNLADKIKKYHPELVPIIVFWFAN
jgi:RNA polymerase sigma-70 factor (ECF subfamily)